MQVDALAHVNNPRVLLIDDVLATGGTLIAALELISDLAGEVCEVAVLLEIKSLGGRDRILGVFPEMRIRALVQI
jgi:adenine phosphoribosyltransferase